MYLWLLVAPHGSAVMVPPSPMIPVPLTRAHQKHQLHHSLTQLGRVQCGNASEANTHCECKMHVRTVNVACWHESLWPPLVLRDGYGQLVETLCHVPPRNVTTQEHFRQGRNFTKRNAVTCNEMHSLILVRLSITYPATCTKSPANRLLGT